MKKKFKKHEKRDAKNFNCYQTISSGNKWQKGDCINNDIMVECKCTEKDQYILKKEVLMKLKNQAFDVDKIPVLSLDINNECWSMIETYKLQELLERKL
jgi:hypothetical protein